MRETGDEQSREDANMPFGGRNISHISNDVYGEGKMAYIEGNTIYRGQQGYGGEALAYIEGNTIYRGQQGYGGREVIGDVGTAKAAFPHHDDYVVAALYVLSKLGRIEDK